MNSLVSDAVSMSFSSSIKRGIPHLVPKNGKTLRSDDATDLAFGIQNTRGGAFGIRLEESREIMHSEYVFASSCKFLIVARLH